LKAVLDLVPYLEKLGISHIYLSPVMKAAAGSTHGYDLVTHKEINPEIGSLEDLNLLSAELSARNMSILLDIVPNHMGIAKDNQWWQGLLEYGEGSAYAHYFDIDWHPVKQELRGKVTLPILGDSYGSILLSGQLSLKFNKQTGNLTLFYYEHELPISPRTYPEVLSLRLDELQRRLPSDSADLAEYKSILSALQSTGNIELPSYNAPVKESELQKKRLAKLCGRNNIIAQFIDENTKFFQAGTNDLKAIPRLHKLLELQSYRLVYWRVANDEINYRRFFDVNSLAAVRTEDETVFDEMHELVFDLIASGTITGLRVDHPDGLFNPAQYFAKLQEEAKKVLRSRRSEPDNSKPLYVVVEKILAQVESLEENWDVHGTTGYDFMNELMQVFIDARKESEFTRIYDEFIGETHNYEEMKTACKQLILDVVLASELNVLANRLSKLAESSVYFRDITLNSLRNALRDVVLYFPVYRTYVAPGCVDKTARHFVDWAVGKAKKNAKMVSHEVYDFVRDVLLLNVDPQHFGTSPESATRFKQDMEIFAMQFQQFTGPVMAKSIEDTLFYRYARFIALNEVGGEPDKMGSSISAFHQRNERRFEKFPHSLLATSTHDTKRSEDVRARLLALSEIPQLWEQKAQLWSRMNRGKKLGTPEEPLPDANDEYFLYQTLVGALPLDIDSEEQISDFRSRMLEYAQKAARESKRFSSWLFQNQEYEKALSEFVSAILTPSTTNTFISDLKSFTNALAPVGLINSIAQTTLKLCCPGVPDFYQGTETWDFSLVDPDNRRKVKFQERDSMLAALLNSGSNKMPQTQYQKNSSAGSSWFSGSDKGELKISLISKLLQQRNQKHELFKYGNYKAILAEGKKAEHVLAFSRSFENKHIIVLVPRLIIGFAEINDEESLRKIDWRSALSSKALWEGTTMVIPENLRGLVAREIVSGKEFKLSDKLELANCFGSYPAFILEIDA
jgi:(1->4)-alpha-D-glucan 1-alpha-D-glucosylmutase